MKMFLVGFAFVGMLVASNSAMTADNTERVASVQPVQPIVAVASADKTPGMRIVDTDYQFSQQERMLIAFWQLQSDAERRHVR